MVVVEEEVAPHLKTSLTPPVAGGAPAGQKNAESGNHRRLATIDPATGTDPIIGLEHQDRRFSGEESPIVAMNKGGQQGKSFSVVTVPATSGKPPDAAKGGGKAGKGGDAAKSAPEASKEASKKAVDDSGVAGASPPATTASPAPPAPEPSGPPPEAEPPMPSAPKDLAPKPRLPDVDMTFYRELPRRKVIVTAEEMAETPGKQPAAATVPPPDRPAAAQEKPQTRGSGTFVVQLAVFNESQRAATMVADLQRRGVPARVVKSKDGGLFRIRLGPFGSHAEASRSLIQWKLDGYSTLIFQDNEG